MKRFLLLFIGIGFLFTTLASAQTEIGFFGSMNITNLNITETEDNIETGTRSGIALGALVKLNLNSKINLVLQPMYSQKGAELSVGNNPDFFGAIITFNIDEFDIPALLRVDLSGGTSKFYVIGGPTIGFISSSKMNVSASELSVEVDLKEAVKSLDFGLAVGSGFSFPFRKGSVFFEGRYQLGLANIIDEGSFEFAGEESELDWSVKNKGFQIMGGITFPLGGK